LSGRHCASTYRDPVPPAALGLRQCDDGEHAVSVPCLRLGHVHRGRPGNSSGGPLPELDPLLGQALPNAPNAATQPPNGVRQHTCPAWRKLVVGEGQRIVFGIRFPGSGGWMQFCGKRPVGTAMRTRGCDMEGTIVMNVAVARPRNDHLQQNQSVCKDVGRSCCQPVPNSLVLSLSRAHLHSVDLQRLSEPALDMRRGHARTRYLVRAAVARLVVDQGSNHPEFSCQERCGVQRKFSPGRPPKGYASQMASSQQAQPDPKKGEPGHSR
jgi:hypothetical protein